MAAYSYEIAAGWDNEINFTNVEDLVPSSGATIPNSTIYFVVKAYNTYRRGQRRFAPSGASSFAGLKQVVWRLLDVDAVAYSWLVSNYEGLVTVATTTGSGGVYTNWNGYARFPDPADLTESDAGRFDDVDIEITLVETT